MTQNAGEAGSKGIEFEGQWLLNKYWQISGSYAYLDTEYTGLDGNLKPNEGNHLRISYTTGSGQWELAGWVKNATDEEYTLHNSTLSPGLAQLTVPAPPSTNGVTATRNFGN